MNELQLWQLLSYISGYDDFTLELKQTHSKTYWGRYFVWRKLIRLYALDENGKQYSDEELIREGLHEIAHHIQYHHIEGWTKQPGIMHDDQFYELHKALLDKTFGRNVPVRYSPIVERIVASRK